MQLIDKVTSNVGICRVEVSTDGIATANSDVNFQLFYDSTVSGTFHKAYVSSSKIDFIEESLESPAGTYYKQKVTISFPSTDKDRSKRISFFQNVKLIKLILSDGLELLIGRNDFHQNALPIIKTKTNKKTCEIDFECKSIFPIGFSNN